MPPVYTTEAAFAAYTSLPVVGWDTAERLLMEAERLVDMALGRYGPVDNTTGLKILPTTLEDWRATALSNAVCAQAEYMLIKGPVFFAEQVPLDPSGPDGSQKGREPLLAPKADRELTYGKLYRLTGLTNAPFPNQNWRDDVP